MHFFSQQNIELVVHCGDWKSLHSLTYFAEQAAQYALPVRGVLGNNDADPDAFLHLFHTLPGTILLDAVVMKFTAGGKRCVIHHGHAMKVLKDQYATTDILFTGHTHKPRVEQVDTTFIVNPGSTAFAIPRSKTWKATVAIVETDPLSARIVELP